MFTELLQQLFCRFEIGQNKKVGGKSEIQKNNAIPDGPHTTTF